MLRSRWLSLWLLLAPLPAVVADGQWPAFRGPDGDGIVRSQQSLPLRWSPEENVIWRTELPGEGWSSPVVGDGRIYLTAAIAKDSASGAEADAQDYELSLLVVDAASGRLLQTVAVMDQLATSLPKKIHSKNSHASPTAIVDGDRVFVHFGYQGTACTTRDGKLIWTNRELFFPPTHGNGGSPVLVDGRLIFTCDGGEQPRVVALDAETGQIAWQSPRPVTASKTFSFCTPSVIEVDGSKQLIAPGSDCVLALDPATGATIWDVRYSGYSVIPKPVHDRGLVFVSTSFDNTKLLAIRPNGSGIVTNTHVAWELDRNVPKTPSMIAHEGLLYTISDDGIALCVDAETGAVVYRQRVGGNFSASPLLAAGHLYLTSEEGVTTVIRAGRQFEKVAANDLGERTLASLAVIGDSIVLRTRDALYRIGQ